MAFRDILTGGEQFNSTFIKSKNLFQINNKI